MNLVEFSKRIGVSKGTVWRALNGKTDIRPKTRDMVLRKAQELGYQPNQAASSLASGKSRLISLIMPELTTPYDTMVVRSLQEHISSAGFNLVIRDMGPVEQWDRQLGLLLQWPMDGIIVLDSSEWTPKLRKYPQTARTPMVCIGAFVEHTGDYVQVELKEGALEAVRHLTGSGSRRIAYVVPERYAHESAPRYQAYSEVMMAAGLEPDCVVLDVLSREAAYLGMRARLADKKPPDAVFCFNDHLAMGVYRALYEAGLTIPADVAVVGCDGIEDSLYMYPTLTTIQQPVDEMCTKAWEYLVRRIESPRTALQQATVSPKLVIRNSTKSKEH